jgi:EAL domain-containing protein (putative c-di-GMP-specific phosphodiesterase class I)
MEGRRLLLLATDARARQSIADAVRQAGCGCEAVETEDAFRRSYAGDKPTFIVLDMDPDDDCSTGALSFLAEQGCKLPVVLVTSFDGTVLDAIGHLARLRGLRIVDVVGKTEAPAHVQRLLQSAESYSVADLQDEIREALRRGEISPRYQPIFELRTGAVVGVEALMRWNHATLGLLPAAYFARAADEAGMFDELGWRVIERAVEEFFGVAHRDKSIFLSVNASPRQLGERGFADRLLRAIRSAGGAPGRIVLEVTESSSMEHPARTLALFGRLRAAGVRLALDDFGKGYSSLSLLQRMPFDILKLDRDFVRRAPDARDARVILSTLVGLGRSLGLTVIAEGIESKACLDIARRRGVKLGQGFHLGEPVTYEALPCLLGRVQASPA